MLVKIYLQISHRAFSDDVTSTILQLVPQNNKTTAMLVSQISPVVVDEYFSYEKSLFGFNKFVWLLATWVKTTGLQFGF